MKIGDKITRRRRGARQGPPTSWVGALPTTFSFPQTARSCPRGKRGETYDRYSSRSRWRLLAPSRRSPTPALARRQSESGVDARQEGILGSAARRGRFPPAGRRALSALGQSRLRISAATFSKDSPLVDCKAAPGPSFFNSPGFEIVDVPELKSIFILNIAGPHSWRVIYMDGRPHPQGEDLRPTFLGHSIGHWEGDTLVIDSVGLQRKAVGRGSVSEYFAAAPHRTHLASQPENAEYEATIDDPGAYTKPWSGKWTITRRRFVVDRRTAKCSNTSAKTPADRFLVTDRKPAARVSRRFQLIDHGNRVVFH